MPAPGFILHQKALLPRGHVIVEQLVLLDNKFKVVRQVLQQFYHDTAATFEAYVS